MLRVFALFDSVAYRGSQLLGMSEAMLDGDMSSALSTEVQGDGWDRISPSVRVISNCPWRTEASHGSTSGSWHASRAYKKKIPYLCSSASARDERQ
jgi:hypothetical protein